MLTEPSLNDIFEYWTVAGEGEIDRCAEEFFGKHARDAVPPLSENVWMPYFRNHVLFDHRHSREGKSLITLYRERNPDHLSAEKLALLAQVERTQAFDMFQVKDVKHGEWMSLDRMRTGTVYQVQEKRGTDDAETGMILFTRIFQVGDHWEVGGEGDAFGAAMVTAFALFIQDHPNANVTAKDVVNFLLAAGEQETADPRAALDDFLRRHARYTLTTELIHEWILERIPASDVINRATGYLGDCEEETVEYLTKLVIAFWNSLTPEERGATVPPGEQYEAGPVEKALQTQFVRRSTEEIDADKYDTLVDLKMAIACFTERWLQTPQPALGGKSPREAYIAERRARGNEDNNWSLQLEISQVGTGDDARIDGILKRAITLTHERKYADAEGLYRDILREQPDAAQCWGNLGLIVAAQGRKEEAIECLRKAIEINPDYRLARENLDDISRSTPEALMTMRMIAKASVLKTGDAGKAIDDWMQSLRSDWAEETETIHDIRALLAWFQEHGPVRVSAKLHLLPRRILPALNAILARPMPSPDHLRRFEGLPAYAEEGAYPVLHLALSMLRASRLLRVTKGKLAITRRGKDALKMRPVPLYCNLLWDYFMTLNWEVFSPGGWTYLGLTWEGMIQERADMFLREFLTAAHEAKGAWVRLSSLGKNAETAESRTEKSLFTSPRSLMRGILVTAKERALWMPLRWFGLMDLDHSKRSRSPMRGRPTGMGRAILASIAGWNEELAKIEQETAASSVT